VISVSLFAVFLGAALTAELQRRHERVLRAAIAKSGQTILQAAQEAEIGQPQFTRQLQGLEGTLKRLQMQPAAFWQWFAVELAQEFGLPEEVETAARLKRMAKMSYTRTVTLPLGQKEQVG